MASILDHSLAAMTLYTHTNCTLNIIDVEIGSVAKSASIASNDYAVLNGSQELGRRVTGIKHPKNLKFFQVLLDDRSHLDEA